MESIFQHEQRNYKCYRRSAQGDKKELDNLPTKEDFNNFRMGLRYEIAHVEAKVDQIGRELNDVLL